jgi:hypothetical protein
MKQTMTIREAERAMRPRPNDPEMLLRAEADVYAAIGVFHRAIDEAATEDDAAALRIRLGEMGKAVHHEECRALNQVTKIYRRRSGGV